MIAIDVLARRIADEVDGLVTVTGLAELIAASGVVRRPPACYIAPGSESAQALAMIGRTSQKVEETFSVWLAVSSGASATGDAAQMALKSLVDRMRTALVGWQPGDAYTPIELVSAGPLRWEDGQMLFWPETYRTEYYLEN